MESYDASSFVADFFHLAQYFKINPCSSMIRTSFLFQPGDTVLPVLVCVTLYVSILQSTDICAGLHFGYYAQYCSEHSWTVHVSVWTYVPMISWIHPEKWPGWVLR